MSTQLLQSGPTGNGVGLVKASTTAEDGQGDAATPKLPATSGLSHRHGQQQISDSTIMIVDDEEVIIKALQKHLRGAGYQRFITTTDSRRALDLVREHQPDAIVLDVMMPHVNGLQILEAIRGDRDLQHLPVIILSAAGDEETRLRALEMGVTDFLSKPLKPTELIPRIRSALVIKAHHDHLAGYSKLLENEVQRRTAELAQSRQEVIHVLASAAEYRDQDTGKHVLRVGQYAGIIAEQLGFSPPQVELIAQAAILHDVGKIGIMDTILLKPGKLDSHEMAAMQKHCDFGMQILLGIPKEQHQREQPILQDRKTQSPILRMAATIAISHHEKWDGSGYPFGLSGESIPIEGRITAVADVFDALTTRRPYKLPLPLVRSLEILEEGRGKHFDPKVLDAFEARMDDVIRIAQEMSDE